jgi:AraC-like DNA-binding protein
LIPDITVTYSGFLKDKQNWADYRFDIFAVGLMISGRGPFLVEGHPPQRMEPPCVFTVYPGPHFKYGPENGVVWNEYCVCLKGLGIKRWVQSGLFPRDGRMHPVHDSAALVERFREIARTFARDGPGDRDRAVVLTERLLIECHQSRSENQRRKLPAPSVEAAMNYCRQHLNENIDFARVAREHAVSYSFLRQRIRQVTGLPPGKFLLQLRCAAAQQLLSDTDLSIKEIGARVGLEDPFGFSRVFKRQTGISPRQYRRQMAPWAERTPLPTGGEGGHGAKRSAG